MNYLIKATTIDSKAKSDGTQTIKIRITIGRQRKYMQVNDAFSIAVHPKNWNEETGFVLKGDTDYRNKNSEIMSRIGQFEKILKLIEANDLPLCIDEFNSRLKNPKKIGGKHNLIKFIEEQMIRQKEDGMQESTIVKHMQLLGTDNKRRSPGGLKLFAPAINIEDCDSEFVRSFKIHLSKHLGSKNTITTRLKSLSVYFNIAIEAPYGYISKNPTRGLKGLMETVESTRAPLDEEELQSLMDLKLTDRTPGLIKTRDRFLFACGTGVAHEDQNDLRWGDMKNGVLGYVRKKLRKGFDKSSGRKLGKIVHVPLELDFVKEIVLRRKKESKGEFVFEPITLNPYNSNLKVLAEMAGIKKKLTSHIARYTCGTLLLNKGMSNRMVADVLGHESEDQTHTYAKFATSSLASGMKKANQSIALNMNSRLQVLPEEAAKRIVEMEKVIKQMQIQLAEEKSHLKVVKR